MTRRQMLSAFSGAGYDKGRPRFVQALWVLASSAIFERIWCPTAVRVTLLRLFGAEVGQNVLIRHGVRIHWPWKLKIGNEVWIGVDAWLLNLEQITIGSNVCISQGALLCTGSHDTNSASFEFDNAPIDIGDEVWVAARATVLRGVRVGERSVIGATSLISKNVAPDSSVYPARSTVSAREEA